MNPDAELNLLERWRNGDQEAAAELFRLYGARLIGLVRSRLAINRAHHFDPEDVVQSACRSFFVGARLGQYELRHGRDLWQLLVTITLHKLHHRLRHDRAQKRGGGQEATPTDLQMPGVEPPATGASPLESLILEEEVERVLRRLEPDERPVFQLRLEGHDLNEISARTRRSQRTVRRILQRVKDFLEQPFP